MKSGNTNLPMSLRPSRFNTNMFGMENTLLTRDYLNRFRKGSRSLIKIIPGNLKIRPTYNYFILALFAGLVLITGCSDKSVKRGVKVPRLSPKYGYKDKEPMGSYIAYHYLNSLFNTGVTDVINKSFSNLQYEINHNQSLYIIVARSVFMSKLDMASMLDYVSEGNTLFISAEHIDQKLLDTLDTDISFSFDVFFGRSEYEMLKMDTWLSLKHDPAATAKKYGFFFVPFDNSVISYDTSLTQVLGYNEEGKPDFIAIDHGRGKFILHTEPSAFSNYFLLTGNNKEYIEKAFSFLLIGILITCSDTVSASCS